VKVVRVKAREGVVRAITVQESAPKGASLKFRDEARAIQRRFASAVGTCRIPKRRPRASGRLMSNLEHPVYSLEFSFMPRQKKYTLRFDPGALRAQERLQARREERGVDCFEKVDPTSFDEVFRCMGSFRQEAGFVRGESRFKGIIGRDCSAIWSVYRQGLREAGVESDAEIRKRRPDCGLFARVSEETRGRPPFWSGCLDYHGTTEAHIEQWPGPGDALPIFPFLSGLPSGCGLFGFQLTKKEHDHLRSQSATSSSWGGRRYPPYAFTEQGVAMLSSVLRSKRAVAVNVQIMRTFVRLRQMLITHKDLAHKIAALENRYDAQFKVVFDALRALTEPPAQNKRRVGFQSGDSRKKSAKGTKGNRKG